MRIAPRAVAATIAITFGLFGATPRAVAGAPAGDGRGATHIHETPQAPSAEGEAVVSLTFDDGPHPDYTPAILDLLAQHGVKATFFMLGREAERFPDLVRRVVAEGHAIANHTWDHKDLRTLDDEGFAQQVDRTSDVLEAITGLRVPCIRPPFGRADARVQERLAARGLTSVVWTADSRDFQKPGADAIVASTLEGLQPGGVLLLHDAGGNRDQTLQALPRIIEGIRSAGYGIKPICAPDPHLPGGALTSVEPRHGRIAVAGWASDPDTDERIDVHLYVDGANVASVPAARPAAGDGAPGPTFESVLRAGPGGHEVCAYAINAGAGGGNPRLGCATVEVGPLTAFDDLRPLVARVRFVQLVEQAAVVREVILAHDVRRRPWNLDDDAVVLARPPAGGITALGGLLTQAVAFSSANEP